MTDSLTLAGLKANEAYASNLFTKHKRENDVLYEIWLISKEALNEKLGQELSGNIHPI